MGCQCSSNGAEDVSSVDLKNKKTSIKSADRSRLRPTQDSKRLSTAYFLNEDADNENDFPQPETGRILNEEKEITFIKSSKRSVNKNLKQSNISSSFSNDDSLSIRYRSDAERIILREGIE